MGESNGMGRYQWRLYGVRSESQIRRLILSLDCLFDETSVLAMDFTAVPDAIAQLARSRGARLPKGSILVSDLRDGSRGRTARIPLRLIRENLNTIAGSAAAWDSIAPYLEHIHVLRGEQMLLAGWDVGEEVYLSPDVPEAALRLVCERVPCLYESSRDEEQVVAADVWQIKDSIEPWECVRHLPVLFPRGAVVGVPVELSSSPNNSIDDQVWAFLEQHALIDKYVLPRTRKEQEEELLVRALQVEDVDARFPDEFQVEVTPVTMAEVASLLQKVEHAGVDELYVRVSRRMVLYFYSCDGIVISADVREGRVKAFAGAMHRSYSRGSQLTEVGDLLVPQLSLPGNRLQ